MFFLFFFLIGTYSVLSYHKIVVTNGGLKVYSLLGFIKKTIRRKDIVSYTIIKKQNTKYKHEVGYIEWEELTIYTKETKVKLYSTNYSNYRKLRKVLTKRGKRDIKKEKDWQKRSDRHWGIGFMSFGLFAIAYLVIISLNEVGFSSSLLFFVLIFLFIIYTGAKLYLRNK